MKRGGLISGRPWLRVLTVLALGLGPAVAALGQLSGVTLLVQSEPQEGGQTNPGAGVHHFTPESEVTLTAVAGPEFQFVCWLGDVADRRSVRTLAYLDKPKIIVAIFRPKEYALLTEVEAAAQGGRSGPVGTALTRNPWPLLPPSALSVGPAPADGPEVIAEPSSVLFLCLAGALVYIKRRALRRFPPRTCGGNSRARLL